MTKCLLYKVTKTQVTQMCCMPINRPAKAALFWQTRPISLGAGGSWEAGCGWAFSSSTIKQGTIKNRDRFKMQAGTMYIRRGASWSNLKKGAWWKWRLLLGKGAGSLQCPFSHIPERKYLAGTPFFLNLHDQAFTSSDPGPSSVRAHTSDLRTFCSYHVYHIMWFLCAPGPIN